MPEILSPALSLFPLDMIPLLCSTVLLLPITTLAQQASAAWRKPNITVVRGDRISIAEAAIEEGITFLDNFQGPLPRSRHLAEFDLATNQTKYAAALQQYFLLAAENLGQLGGVQNFTGEYVSQLFVEMPFLSAEQIRLTDERWLKLRPRSGYGLFYVQKSRVLAICGASVVGGKRIYPDPEERRQAVQLLSKLHAGPHLSRHLSALLAEATQDDLYLDAAKASADFIRAHLYNVNNIVQDSISARANDSCAEAASEFSSDSGVVIEGLAILYSITHNASIHDMIGDMLTSVIPHTGWQGPDGIIANGAEKTSDLILPRALATVKARNATTPLLQSYIDAYLSVQAGPSASSGPSAAASPRKSPRLDPLSVVFVGGLIVLVGVIVGALLFRRRTRVPGYAEEPPVAGVVPPQVTQVTPTTVHPFDLRANHAPPSAPPSSTPRSPIQSVAGHGNTTTNLSTAHGTGSMSPGSSTQEVNGSAVPRNNGKDGDADEPPPDYRASEFHK
ncbi:hypothetical protein B0H14DRAFT_3751419 [Mycena olivaceomarginata]|nr:hypothetical protein B0H14DRAFT_3751419 [Mycena olivaceomarginata]